MNFFETSKDNNNYDSVRSYLYFCALKLKNVNKTRYQKLIIIKSFHQFLIRNNIIEQDKVKYIELPKLPKKLPRFITLDEVDHILKNMNTRQTTRDKLIISILYGSGLRITELITLKIQNIFVSEKLIFVENGKGNKDRYVPISDLSLRLLFEYQQIQRAELELLNGNTTDILLLNCRGAPLTRHGVQYMLTSICKKLKVGHLHPHMFRHGFAILMLENGMNIRYIQELLGHSSIISTQIYLQVNIRKLKQTIEKYHPLCKK
jgi:Site-specific recombinase XerD